MVYDQTPREIKNLRILITQADGQSPHRYHVSFEYSDGHQMSDSGEAESVEDAFQRCMVFVKTKPFVQLSYKMFSGLTERNLMIFRLYAVEGMQYKHIAERVGIVRPRVAYHVYRVRDALGAVNVQQAIFMATAAGLIP